MLVAVSFAACGSPTFFVRARSKVPGAAARPGATDAHLDVDALLDEIARVRGHRYKAKIPVSIVGDAEFDAVYRARFTSEELKGAALGNPAPFDGFYHVERKTVFVRKRLVGTPRLLHLVSHELEHALQDQRFGSSDESDASADPGLARRALSEGDAELTAVAVEAHHRGRSVRRAIRAIREVVPEFSEEDDASDVKERATLRFLYRDGAAFAAALWQGGGFALLDDALREPPRTTTEVLHPERYLQGVQPWSVAPTSLGPATTNESIGEFGLARFFMSLGTDRDNAFAIASEWQGDAYSRRDDAEAWTIVTTSPWLTGETLRRLGGEVRTRGNVVSFARHTNDDTHFAELGLDKASSERPKQPSARVANVVIPAAKPWLFARVPPTAVRRGNVVALPNYGLRIPVLEHADRAPLGKFVLLDFKGSESSASIQADVLYPKDAPLAELVAPMDGGVTAQFGAWNKAARDVVTPMGAGYELVYTTENRSVVRGLAFRACRNTTAFTILTMASNERARSEVDRWVSGIDVRGLESSAFCKEINADNTPDDAQER